MLLSWMFISSHTAIFFFVTKFIFSNAYISVNTMFECLYMSFGWERGHQLSTCATDWGMGVIQNVYDCQEKERVSRLKCMYTSLLRVYPRLCNPSYELERTISYSNLRSWCGEAYSTWQQWFKFKIFKGTVKSLC